MVGSWLASGWVLVTRKTKLRALSSPVLWEKGEGQETELICHVYIKPPKLQGSEESWLANTWKFRGCGVPTEGMKALALYISSIDCF